MNNRCNRKVKICLPNCCCQCRPRRGVTGPRGITGARGVTGARGITGARGVTGPAGSTAATAAIIPFASGGDVAVTTVLGQSANTGTMFAFGYAVSGINVSTGTIVIGSPIFSNNAFASPRNGTITSLSGFFSVRTATILPTPVQIILQIYTAPAASNTFTPAGTPLALTPTLGPVVAVGDTASGAITESIPVITGEKILLVVLSSTLGVDVATSVIGFTSAGIAIA